MYACCHLDSSWSSKYSAASVSPPRGIASSCTAAARSVGTCTAAVAFMPRTRHADQVLDVCGALGSGNPVKTTCNR